MQDLTNLAGRLLMAAIFVQAGFGKLTHYSGTVQSFAHLGIPAQLLPLVILLEFGGGIALVLGLLTRLVAFGLAVFCILTAVIVHYHPGDHMQMINFMKNLAMCGGFLFILAYGPGRMSLDRRFGLPWR